MMYPLNAAAQDIANELPLTKGRVANEKISAGLVARQVKAIGPRPTSFAKTISPGISAPSLSASFGAKKSNVVYLAPRARNIMPAPSPRFFGMAA